MGRHRTKSSFISNPDEKLQGVQAIFYKIIKEYLDIRQDAQTDSNRFFLSTKSMCKGLISKDPKKFFTRQNLGKNIFNAIIKNTSEKLGIRKDGALSLVTTHGMRATTVSLLFEAGYDNATITLRIGHKDIRSLGSYHNL